MNKRWTADGMILYESEDYVEHPEDWIDTLREYAAANNMTTKEVINYAFDTALARKEK